MEKEEENNVFYAHFLKNDEYYCLRLLVVKKCPDYKLIIKEKISKITNYEGPFIISQQNNENTEDKIYSIYNVLFIYGKHCERYWRKRAAELTNIFVVSDRPKRIFDIKNILEIIQYKNWDECKKNNIFVRKSNGTICDPDYDNPQPQIKQLYIHYIDKMSDTVSHCKYENYDSSKSNNLYPDIVSDSDYLKTSSMCKIIPPFNFFIRDRDLEILSGDNISITNITSSKYWKLRINDKLYIITDFKDIFDLIGDERYNFLNLNPCKEVPLTKHFTCILGVPNRFLD